jgi:ribosome-associated protein
MPGNTGRNGVSDGQEKFSIPDDDEALLAQCRVETFRAGGPGGQHQNTTESAVRLVHEPTGATVVARDERSQHRNRKLALQRLRVRLEELNRPETPRIETKVPPSQRRKRLENKRRRSEKKKRRKPPEMPE